ncbi:MAG: hypothetical protein IJP12_00295 [Methanobrevibacter sp.]|nr:hypothetical protein [Methanobrevibacter sp.]
MKFKNSYILLISLISIFLLLSVSAVSAANDQFVSDSVALDDACDMEIDDLMKDTNQLSDGDEGAGCETEAINTTVESADVKLKANETVNMAFVVKDNESKAINVSADLIKVMKDEEELNFTYTNSTISLKDKLDVGIYTLKLCFIGNETYNPSDKDINVTVYENNILNISDTTGVNKHTKEVKIPVSVKNGNETINVTKEDLSIVYTYFDSENNVTVVKDLTDEDFDFDNSTIKFVADSLNKANVTVTYKKGSLNETEKTTDIVAFTSLAIIPVNTTLSYQDGSFIFKVVDNDTGELIVNETITVSGVYFFKFANGTSLSTSKQFTTDSKGLISIKNENMNKDFDTAAFIYNYTALTAGSYNLTFRGNASLVVDVNGTLPVTVKKVTAVIKASNMTAQVGSGKRYSFRVVNKETGKALKYVDTYFKIKLNGNYTTLNATTNKTGYSAFTLNIPGGTYSVIISNRDSNMVASSVKASIKMTKIPCKLTAKNRVIYYNSAKTAVIKLTRKSNGKAVANAIVKVRIYVTSKKYADVRVYTNSKGVAQFSVGLTLGKHKMIISTDDGNYTASSITRYVTLKKTKAKFTVPKVTTYYNSGKIFNIKLTNTNNNNPIYGSQMEVRIFVSNTRYYKYTATTDGNGLVRLNLSSYKPGTYKIVAVDADEGYVAAQKTGQLKITKVPTKLAPKAYSGAAGKYFQVKVTHKSNKKALAGVKLNVKVYSSAKSYKTYTIRSNSKGIANLKVTQKPGTYKVVVSSAHKYYVASSVKSTIKVTK